MPVTIVASPSLEWLSILGGKADPLTGVQTFEFVRVFRLIRNRRADGRSFLTHLRSTRAATGPESMGSQLHPFTGLNLGAKTDVHPPLSLILYYSIVSQQAATSPTQTRD